MIGLIVALVALAGGALLLVLRPLLRDAGGVPPRARFDRAVYRDQLQELDRDIGRGLIGEAEAQTARLEIERRLLAAGDAAPPAVRAGRSPLLAAAVGVVMLGGATGLYLTIGAPGVPDAPYAERVKPRQGEPAPEMAQIVATLQERVRDDPANGEAWQLLGRAEAARGNWAGAAEAYRHLVELGGATADTLAGYGEMEVLAAAGVVTPAARAAFTSALQQDGSNAIAKFYLALAEAQVGHGRQAIDAWVALAGETPDADIRAEIARRVTATAKASGIAAPALPPAPAASPAPAAGPGPAQVAAAAEMPVAQRNAMIKTMVGQLAAKLDANPGDFDGWMRLGRAYAVLGELDRSADAYGRAAALRPGTTAPLLEGVKAMTGAQKDNAPIPPQAVDLLRRAEALDPKQPETLWYLGLAEAQARHREAAEGYWKRLLALLPADSQGYKLVSDALAAMGKH